jgi:3-methyladenine DNA glycosylase/8-oxoguanine DNA glycosylase
MARRAGRGRLSSIDLLPDAADPVVAWAFQELKERDRTQKEIHAEFNERLAEIDLGPISLSAFNRHSIRLAALAKRQTEVRAITAALTERLEPGQTDELTIIAAEMIKTLVFELMEDGESITPKGAMELARALQSAVASQKHSVDRAREVQKRLAEQVDDALDKVSAEKGLSADQAASIRREVLGVRS